MGKSWIKPTREALVLDGLLIKNYMKCIDVILSNEVDNGKFDDEDFCDTTDKQIKRIVNMQDKPSGNIYVVKNIENSDSTAARWNIGDTDKDFSLVYFTEQELLELV